VVARVFIQPHRREHLANAWLERACGIPILCWLRRSQDRSCTAVITPSRLWQVIAEAWYSTLKGS